MGQVPAAVAAFIGSNIEGVDQLRVLAVMVDADGRWWDARMLARELGIRATKVGRILEAFAARNLLDIRVTEQVRYQFHPGTGELHRLAHEAAAWFRRDPVALMQCLDRSLE